MPHLFRVTTLGVVALALVVPGTATAQAKKKPKHTVTVNTVDALPKALKKISRKCGASKSATKIRKRVSTRSSSRVRVVTTYCSGGTRTVFYIKTVTKTVTVPAPAPTPAPTAVPQPAAPTPAPAPRSFRLTLLHNNDGESKYNVGDSVANYGGVTRFKTVLDRLRGEADAYRTAENEDKGTVVVSSGDNILAGLNLRASFERKDAGQGSFYDAIALGRIGYDAITIGNHEYDFGPTRLAQLIDSPELTGVPFLTANTDFAAAPDLQRLRTAGRIADSTVVTKGGQKIGIIGVTTPDTPVVSSPGPTVKFLTDVAGIVNAEAARLTNAGVNKIILSSHLQNLNYEKTLIASLRNVDIVISGGGDELLANPSDVLIPGTNGVRPTPADVYPATAKDADGAAVPVVTTQGEYKYVGRLTVDFDAAGKIKSTDTTRSGPIRVSALASDPDYVSPEDAFLKTDVTDKLTAYKAVLKANVIGTTEVELQGAAPDPIRIRETNLGNLVADGFLFAANRTAVADGRKLAQVAFSNGGGIRATIAGPGKLNELNTYEVLPFDNVIATVPDVPRATFKALMEHGVSRLPTADGRFPQISGFRMTVSTGQAAGSRVRTLTLDDGTEIVKDGVVVDGPPVSIATTNFTAAGGDGYPWGGLKFDFAGNPGAAGFYPYQKSLLDFITTPVAQGGLGGLVDDADYPVAGEGRIVIGA
ncbi:bifunctional metallophosphatase/5'-nucleotidase [Solirubrobacter sp. CPCC 204708]|uniref:Bifunctional metallophosphatase/5'-nucleotidase n=1 Tax=Solirubrobacter deserti TaxID=2282478 RepID=A0ABT4RFK6_9ACTN|nr:bifunctional metallophosphatase/5'-nucleotidase [Solirubrobacter deserti]MBE2318063.1 bifunctional metallophosphatase/5'-nucleotidase [Solirubrobacter deserti]MDA0137341.1 bifunctional metallophosphatase/5'-nucleotidase [Solirubrobacter deserti]